MWEITKVARGDRELEEMFQELDVDQDGHITREEMEVRRRTRIFVFIRQAKRTVAKSITPLGQYRL